jgi:hypothetical protein
MAAPFYVQTLASNRATGAVFATFTTAKTVLNVADVVQLPVNYLVVGSKLRIRVAANLACVGTTSGTVTFQVMMGAVVAWTSGALQMTTTAEATSLPIIMEIVVRVTAVDVTAGVAACTLLGTGYVIGLIPQLGAGVAVPTVTDSVLVMPAAAPTNGTVFQSETVENIDFWTGFSISNANNSIQITDYTVEQLQ